MENQTKIIIFYDLILSIEQLGLVIVTLYFAKKVGKHTLEVGDSVRSGDNEGEVSVKSGVYEDSVGIGHRHC